METIWYIWWNTSEKLCYSRRHELPPVWGQLVISEPAAKVCNVNSLLDILERESGEGGTKHNMAYGFCLDFGFRLLALCPTVNNGAVVQ